MDKRRLLPIVNALLALAFLMTATGGLIRYFAPDAIPYGVFRLIHPLFGITLVLLVVVHIALNANWIKMTYFKKR